MMKAHIRLRRTSGFTLIELLIVIALIVVVLAIGLPGMKKFIVNSRIKSVAAQLATDFQFARAEAASRNLPVYWSFREVFGAQTCYTIFTTTLVGSECDCSLGAGAACTHASQRELRTVQVDRTDSIKLSIGVGGQGTFAFDNVNGGLYYGATDFGDAVLTDMSVNVTAIGDATRKLRVYVSPAGRVNVCTYGSFVMPGYPTCPT